MGLKPTNSILNSVTIYYVPNSEGKTNKEKEEFRLVRSV
jgi:hypothetical protein